MIDLADVRAIATPQSLAKYLLGSPVKERRNELWYKSPFRDEMEASFEVSDRGFHDFGTGEHYDIFSFVQKLKRCSFKDSVEILASIYGIADRDYESRKLAEWYRRQREQEEKRAKIRDWFYLRVWDAVDAEDRENRELTKMFAGDFSDNTYKICLDRQNTIDMMKEQLADYTETWQDKEELMKKAMRGELPKWLTIRLRNHIMTLESLGIVLNQKREY